MREGGNWDAWGAFFCLSMKSCWERCMVLLKAYSYQNKEQKVFFFLSRSSRPVVFFQSWNRDGTIVCFNSQDEEFLLL